VSPSELQPALPEDGLTSPNPGLALHLMEGSCGDGEGWLDQFPQGGENKTYLKPPHNTGEVPSFDLNVAAWKLFTPCLTVVTRKHLGSWFFSLL